VAHTLRDKTEAEYELGDLMEKRRLLMVEWATFCERIGATGEVCHYGPQPWLKHAARSGVRRDSASAVA
jgi:hypothetical protein